MGTTEIKFEISKNLLLSLNRSKKEFTEQLRLLTAFRHRPNGRKFRESPF